MSVVGSKRLNMVFCVGVWCGVGVACGVWLVVLMVVGGCCCA